MSKNNEKLGNKKIDSLEVGTTYKVNYSCFRKVNGKRGDFMSASFIIENADGDKVWVSTPNERSAYKAIGVMTAARINGNKTSITGLRVVKNGKYLEFEYDVTEYIPELDEEEFEDITDEGDTPF
ncbi:MAG: hypothetical protein J6R52_00020 [Alphaproteobacteria bacterium]|nr:hypothetical protein [Alphaproteobacteria bacterium]